MKLPPPSLDQIKLKGGLDQVTPSLTLPPGFVKQASNFECSVFGGYTRIDGYERFDGRPSPSAATQTMVFIATMLSTPSVGQTLTGATSGATGVIATVEAGYVVITKQSLAFTQGEMARVGATDIGLVTASTGAISAEENAIHLAAAADIYRADITAVPGSGSVRGVFVFNDLVYAFRDNAGATAVDLYKSSASGWVNVPYYYEVSFTAGTTAPTEGATLTQGGVTATLKRAVLESGAWTGSAAGRLIISAPAGGNFAAGAATIGGTTVTLSGAQSAITFLPGGKFETVKANFAGTLSTYRVYGCDGANRAFEFDGDILVPINCANLGSNDKPKHIAAHKNMLFLAVQTSVFNSAPGLPYDYTALSGAAEIAIGDTVTGLIPAPGTTTTATLFVFGLQNTSILYGTSAATFNLVSYQTGLGAAHYSAQNMMQTLVMDDRGVYALQASLNYGNFDSAMLTNNITPFMEAHRTRLSCSSLDRSKSQYRLFFSDGFGLYITIVNGKWIGSMPIYFKHIPYCVTNDKFSDGEEASFFGGTDGYVYQMDKGTSFDGQNIYAYLTLTYNASGNSRALKSYRGAAIEVQGNGYAAFNFGYKLGYNSELIAQPGQTAYASNFSLPYWDSFTWDNFVWDGNSLMPSECDMTGDAENVAIAITDDANYHGSYTINGIIVHYLQRRLMRVG
ncbi:MAG TPA: hypothetical protein VK149_12335 [Sideroxyarcus sp.]|nr:hypothetical protein [Sideroxyarcus sp.]